MQTLFKKVDYTLNILIENIELGIIGLPDIQRPFIWKPTRVRDLFDSMFKGFPVGYLLFWESGTGDGTKQIGLNDKQKVPRLLIVDGQQRLTSLYSVLKGKPVLRDDFTEQKIRIAFRPKDSYFEVADAAIKRDPEYIPDISSLWTSGVGHVRFITQFMKSLKDYRAVSDEEEDIINTAIDRLFDLQSYPFTAVELSPSVDEENVANVFVRINSQGMTLNQSDFILTLMSVFWDEGRTELEKFSRSSKKPSTHGSSPFNYYMQPDPDDMLRVSVGLGFRRARLKYAYSLLRGKDLQTELFSDEMRIKQFAILKEAQSYTLDNQNWHEFLKSLLMSGYKSSSMISSKVGIIYSYVFYLIGKRDFQIESKSLRKIIAKWFFMQAITRRYTGSPETVMEQDFSRLRDCHSQADFIIVLNKIIEEKLTDDFWKITLPNELAVSSATAPALFAYYASLVLLDANVLFSNLKVSSLLDPSIKSNKSATERHHLFPRNYLKSVNISDIKETNQIANFALVEWKDNIDISDEPPSSYLPEYLSILSTDLLNKMYYRHALPENWESMDYKIFLEQRRKLIANVIKNGFDKLNSM